MICPKCQDLMRTITRGSVHVDQCENCKGVFLDGGELEQIIAAERAHYAQPYRPEGVPVATPMMAVPPTAAPTMAAPTVAAPTGAAPMGTAPTGAAPTGVAPTTAMPIEGTLPVEGALPVEAGAPTGGDQPSQGMPAGPPPPYQPPPGTHVPGAPVHGAQPAGAPPPYQPPPGTAPVVPTAYPGGYYDQRHHPRRKRSFLEELLD